MAADTPLAVCLAISAADQTYPKSVNDMESQSSSSEDGTSLMDAYKDVLNAQVSNFDCFTKTANGGNKNFKFD